MRTLVLRFGAPFIAILVAQALFPQWFAVRGLGAAAVFALVLGLLNAVVRPILDLLALPITCLTLGLFHFVINGIVFALAAYLVPGIGVSGFLAAMIGALVVGAVGIAMSMVVREEA